MGVNNYDICDQARSPAHPRPCRRSGPKPQPRSTRESQVSIHRCALLTCFVSIFFFFGFFWNGCISSFIGMDEGDRPCKGSLPPSAVTMYKYPLLLPASFFFLFLLLNSFVLDRIASRYSFVLSFLFFFLTRCACTRHSLSATDSYTHRSWTLISDHFPLSKPDDNFIDRCSLLLHVPLRSLCYLKLHRRGRLSFQNHSNLANISTVYSHLSP